MSLRVVAALLLAALASCTSCAHVPRRPQCVCTSSTTYDDEGNAIASDAGETFTFEGRCPDTSLPEWSDLKQCQLKESP